MKYNYIKFFFQFGHGWVLLLYCHDCNSVTTTVLHMYIIAHIKIQDKEEMINPLSTIYIQ